MDFEANIEETDMACIAVENEPLKLERKRVDMEVEDK